MAGEGSVNRVKQSANAPHIRRAAAVYGNDVAGDDALMERVFAFLGGYLLSGEIFFKKLLIRAGDRLVQSVLVFVCDCNIFFGERDFGAHALIVEVVKLHRHKVDKLEFSVSLDRHQSRAELRSEFIVKLVENSLEARFGIVVFIDKERAGQLLFRSHIPRKLSADLGARLAVDNDDSGVRGADRASHLALKVKRSGGVKQIDFYGVPGEGRNPETDGKAAPDLFGIEIAYGVSFGYLAEAVG